MRDFRSVGYNFNYILGYLAFIFSITNNLKEFQFLYDHTELIVSMGIIILILSVQVIVVNRNGILKKLFFPEIKLNFKSWRDIKCFADVDEVSHGKHGKSISKVIWFIDYNDKLCFRVTNNRRNFVKLCEAIDKFEEKLTTKLVVRGPYWPAEFLVRLGLKKIKLPPSNESDLTISQKKTLNLLKNRYEKGEDIYDIAHTMNLQGFFNFKDQ